MVHVFPILGYFHQNHHQVVDDDAITGFHWSNIFLFFDNWKSTLDQWTMEVIPTFIFSLITGHWWIFVFYYIWAAFIQESIEHNPNVNLYPFLTSGQWHLIHHDDEKTNFGIFFPIWDKLFETEK